MNRTRFTPLATAVLLGGTALLTAYGGLAPEPEPTPEGETLSIRIELLRKQLLAVHPEGQVDTFRVSVGSKYHPTPQGEFAIRRIEWNPSWTPPKSAWARDRRPAAPGAPDNPMGRVKMLFKHPTYFIHGTNEPEVVGHVASHGCVRLRDEDAVRLARMVMRHGGAERPDSWFERVLARVRSTETVRLARPVPVRVVEGEPWRLLGTPVADGAAAEQGHQPPIP